MRVIIKGIHSENTNVMYTIPCKWRFGSQSASTKIYTVKRSSNLHCHHDRDQNHQMPRITYKTVIIRQVEQFLIAASLLELILDTDTSDDLTVKWRLKFEPEDEENKNLAPLEMIEFFKSLHHLLKL
jgi:hypothetical protein